MGGVRGETNGSLAEKRAGKETANAQPSINTNFGELLWVKLRENSWWPAQIVDENLVSSANKPRKGSSNDVLVRLYGSYTYKYVDIHSASTEFKSVLIKNNFNYHDILKKSLDQDLASLNSSKSRKRQQSKSKGKAVTEASQNGTPDKSQVSSKKRKEASQTPEIKAKKPEPTLDGANHDTNPSTPNTSAKGLEALSPRRVKVMQSLGLVAPSGSPFPRNQVISANPTARK